jgi:hypothetical protein
VRSSPEKRRNAPPQAGLWRACGAVTPVPAARAGRPTPCPRQDAGLSNSLPAARRGDPGRAASRSARSACGLCLEADAFASRRPTLASRAGEHRTPRYRSAACRPVWRTSASGRSDYEKLEHHYVKCRDGSIRRAFRCPPDRPRQCHGTLLSRAACAYPAHDPARKPRRGRPPSAVSTCRAPAMAGRSWPPPQRGTRQGTAATHSERCCGIPASSARTSVSLYRR